MKFARQIGSALVLLVLAAGLGALLPFLLRPSGEPRGPQPESDPAAVPASAPAEPWTGPAVDGAPGPATGAVESDCVERNNEATRLLAEGELEKAVELFRACIECDPDQPVYRRNLCEGLVRLAHQDFEDDHDLGKAIPHLEEALGLAVEREDRAELEALLARWKTEWSVSQDDLVEPSLYFELAYDPARDDLLHQASRVMDLLDQAYTEMLEWFLVDPVRDSGRRIRIAFYDKDEFDKVTGLGDWAGGVFDGTIRIAVDSLNEEPERWSRVARHELVHAFVRALGGPEVPGWLNEGLAQWLDYSSFPSSRRVEQIAAARERLRGSALFPLERLQGSLATWTDRGEIARAYAQSLAMVDFIDRFYGQDVLRSMIAGVKQGKGVAETFRERTAVDLATVLTDLSSELSR